MKDELKKEPMTVWEGPEKVFKELKEKARKWDKVSSLISGDCNLCPAFIYCTNNSIHPCEILKDALEGGQDDKS
jgi:hypothetical protein